MEKISFWGGLDAGADRSRLCLINEKLQSVLDCTLASKPAVIAEALQPFADFVVENIAVETSACAAHIVRGLRSLGFNVTIYQASQVSRYLRMRRNKTDDNDARGLAELAKLQLPSMGEVLLKSADIQKLRTKLQFRHKLTFQRVGCEGMIRSLIRLHGGKLKSSQSARAIDANVRTELRRLVEESGVNLAPDILPLLSLAVEMRKYLAAVDGDIRKWAEAHPICSRFLEIPGIGPLCAVSFYTAIEDPNRFKSAADVGPYLGLTPKVLQSGMSLKHGRISKMGNKLTRSHLVNAATVIFAGRIKDHPLKVWGLKVAQRAGTSKARVAVARRMAVTMLAMWKNGTRYEESLSLPRASG